MVIGGIGKESGIGIAQLQFQLQLLEYGGCTRIECLCQWYECV